VDELLSVFRVALVGVEADQLGVVEEEEGFPYGGNAVVGDRCATGSDVGDEFPGAAFVGA
jgi:hypothetical protein